jgi:hypothetical protein
MPNTTNSDVYFSNGFVATIAQQAYYELWPATGAISIIRSFAQNYAWRENTNKLVFSMTNTKSFLQGTYSNINDLTSADVGGVCLAFKTFGDDLIKLGKAINLATIDKFGSPDQLLLNLQKNNALTDALKFSLLNNGLTVDEVQNILFGRVIASPDQNAKIWTAFTMVMGTELASILQIINCQTSGITALSDLLVVRKMFPNSYDALTVPRYTLATVQSKIYDFIYTGGGVNERITDYSTYIYGSVPADVAKAAAAFGYSLQQIKNIKNVDFEKFAQVVAQMEVTNKDLPMINSATGVPGDTSVAQSVLNTYAKGSGNSGSYRMADFYGAASGRPYTTEYQKIIDLLNGVATPTLSGYYQTLYATANTITDSDLQTLIANINTAIAQIQTSRPSDATNLNFYWSRLGKQLASEQSAITASIPNTDAVVSGAVALTDVPQWVQSLENYAQLTDFCESAQIIEDISDMSMIGGQSQIGVLREARNSKRLIDSGIDPDNNVDNADSTSCAQATLVVTNGVVTGVNIVNGGTGYDTANPPLIFCSNPSVKLQAIITQITPVTVTLGGYQVLGGTITGVNIANGGTNVATTATLTIQCPPPPKRIGDNPVAGFFNGNPYINQVPNGLISPPSASFTPQQAIADVTICNCDCWHM